MGELANARAKRDRLEGVVLGLVAKAMTGDIDKGDVGVLMGGRLLSPISFSTTNVASLVALVDKELFFVLYFFDRY